MFDRFKLFRNSANEKITKRSHYSQDDPNGPTVISEPIRARSMTPYDPRLTPQFNQSVSPIALESHAQYPAFSTTSSSDCLMQSRQSFPNYVVSTDRNLHRLVPMNIIQSYADQSSTRVSSEPRKSRSRDTELPKKDETLSQSVNRYERQKAKELYAALKQRDANKMAGYHPTQDQCVDGSLQKPIKLMSSQEFNQMIQNDPRLRQYVDNKNRPLMLVKSHDSQNSPTAYNSKKLKPVTNPYPCQNQTQSCDTVGPGLMASKFIETNNQRKNLNNKSKSVNIQGLVQQPWPTMPSPNDTTKKESSPNIYQSTNSGTDSSDYATHYASMRKYASDFEASLDLESSMEMIAQGEKKFGYYSDSDSILNQKLGKRESGTNTDLSDLVNQKLIGLRKFMNTSGLDPAVYLAYQKNLLASKKPSSLSADKDRIYGIVLNSHIARSSAGPTHATLDDFQPSNSLPLPSQQYLRSNSGKYSDFPLKDKSLSQSIKLPYATNIVNYAMKPDQGDPSQNVGSNLSLVSNESCRSTAEEKQAQEIRKLRQELEIAQQKIITLSSRLATNAHMASAFELSLMNMTERLQKLTDTSEKKDHELLGLRSIIQSLKDPGNHVPLSSVNHGKNLALNLGRSYSATASPAHFQSNIGQVPGCQSSEYDSMSGFGQIGSSESCTSLNSGTVNQDGALDPMKKNQKKGWFRSSLGKAFRKKPKIPNVSLSDVETDYYTTHSIRSNEDNHISFIGETSTNTIENLKQQLEERDLKLTDVQLEALSSAHQLEQLKELLTAMRHEMSNLRADNERLQKMIPINDEGDLYVNNKGDTSDHGAKLPLDNDRENDKINNNLNSMKVTNYSDVFSHLFKFSSSEETSIGVFIYFNDTIVASNGVQSLTKRITLGSCHISDSTTWHLLELQIKTLFKEYLSFIDPFANLGINYDCIEQFHLGNISKSVPVTDDSTDGGSARSPTDHIDRRTSSADTNQIKVVIRNTHLQVTLLDALAFETLIPKTVLQRYVSLLLEHRLIILCGPSGTGKSYLANKLAKHLIYRQGQEILPSTLATFTVDQKSNKELRTYLSSIADQSQSYSSIIGNQESTDRNRKPPLVVVLDNLHHVNSLAEIFDSFLTSNVQNCPFVIGTMTQASFSNTNLQTHHNFRWVLCANHMEPVKGFLGRYLRRKLIQVEWDEKVHNEILVHTVEWISKVWQHINKFLESHSSSDVTIGPRLFLSCPMSIEGSQIWFTDLWNYSLVPYLLEAVREGLQTFGRRSKWEDPVDWIVETWPWVTSSIKTRNSDPSSLIRLRPEDVGYDSHVPLNMSMTSSSSRQSSQNSQMISHPSSNAFMQDPRISLLSGSVSTRSQSPHGTLPRTDPLFNMLMKLQEAANYSTGSSGNESEISATKSNSLTRVSSSTVGSMAQKSHIHKVYKTDIL